MLLSTRTRLYVFFACSRLSVIGAETFQNRKTLTNKCFCSRESKKQLLKKLRFAVNYSTESYTFSHKSMVLSAVVRCKYSFYFFWKILHTPGFCLQKHVWTQKYKLFSKMKKNDRFVENTLNRTYESWYKTRKSMNVAQLWRGWVIFHPYRLFTFTLLRLRETYIFWNSKSHRTLNLQLP